MLWRAPGQVVERAVLWAGRLVVVPAAVAVDVAFVLADESRAVGWVTVCLLVADAALWLRRRFPVPVLVVAVGAQTALYAVPSASVQQLAFCVSVVVACYSVAVHAGGRARSAAMGAVLAALVVRHLLLVGWTQPLALVAPLVMATAAWLIGDGVYHRRRGLAALRERARRMEAEQALTQLQARTQAERAVVEERARIARELHDVVAHQVTVIAMHTAVARLSAPADGAALDQALGTVEQASRTIIEEMQHMLTVLRSDPDAPPQPGLSDLAALVDEFRAAGLPARLHLSRGGLDDAVAAGVQLSAYRIVEQALTNVVRHAPGAAVDVSVHGEEGGITIEVRNHAPPRSAVVAQVATGGHGLVGMRERTAMHGGQITHGPTADGGFVVQAWLPRGRQQ